MDPRHTESFLQSLNATTVPQLVEVARLWEDELLVTYRCPFFLVRVGDVQASFYSSATALSLYKEVTILQFSIKRFSYELCEGSSADRARCRL
jgi:hypothetical protein